MNIMQQQPQPLHQEQEIVEVKKVKRVYKKREPIAKVDKDSAATNSAATNTVENSIAATNTAAKESAVGQSALESMNDLVAALPVVEEAKPKKRVYKKKAVTGPKVTYEIVEKEEKLEKEEKQEKEKKEENKNVKKQNEEKGDRDLEKGDRDLEKGDRDLEKGDRDLEETPQKKKKIPEFLERPQLHSYYSDLAQVNHADFIKIFKTFFIKNHKYVVLQECENGEIHPAFFTVVNGEWDPDLIIQYVKHETTVLEDGMFHVVPQWDQLWTVGTMDETVVLNCLPFDEERKYYYEQA